MTLWFQNQTADSGPSLLFVELQAMGRQVLAGQLDFTYWLAPFYQQWQHLKSAYRELSRFERDCPKSHPARPAAEQLRVQLLFLRKLLKSCRDSLENPSTQQFERESGRLELGLQRLQQQILEFERLSQQLQCSECRFWNEGHLQQCLQCRQTLLKEEEVLDWSQQLPLPPEYARLRQFLDDLGRQPDIREEMNQHCQHLATLLLHSEADFSTIQGDFASQAGAARQRLMEMAVAPQDQLEGLWDELLHHLSALEEQLDDLQGHED